MLVVKWFHGVQELAAQIGDSFPHSGQWLLPAVLMQVDQRFVCVCLAAFHPIPKDSAIGVAAPHAVVRRAGRTGRNHAQRRDEGPEVLDRRLGPNPYRLHEQRPRARIAPGVAAAADPARGRTLRAPRELDRAHQRDPARGVARSNGEEQRWKGAGAAAFAFPPAIEVLPGDRTHDDSPRAAGISVERGWGKGPRDSPVRVSGSVDFHPFVFGISMATAASPEKPRQEAIASGHVDGVERPGNPTGGFYGFQESLVLFSSRPPPVEGKKVDASIGAPRRANR